MTKTVKMKGEMQINLGEMRLMNRILKTINSE
jgi:hypothetical protein